jgi:hypothetical protein
VITIYNEYGMAKANAKNANLSPDEDPVEFIP